MRRLTAPPLASRHPKATFPKVKLRAAPPPPKPDGSCWEQPEQPVIRGRTRLPAPSSLPSSGRKRCPLRSAGVPAAAERTCQGAPASQLLHLSPASLISVPRIRDGRGGSAPPPATSFPRLLPRLLPPDRYAAAGQRAEVGINLTAARSVRGRMSEGGGGAGRGGKIKRSAGRAEVQLTNPEGVLTLVDVQETR